MKRFGKYIFATVWAVVLCLSGCVKDSAKGECPPPDKEEIGNYFSLKVDLRNGNGGTRYYDGDRDATAHEQMIDAARIVIYANGSVHYIKDLDISNIGADDISLADEFTGADVADSSSPLMFQTKTIDLEEEGFNFNLSDYRFLLLLNPGDRIKQITEIGQPLSALEAPADYVEADFIGENGNRFLMSNAQGLIHISSSGSFYKTEEKAAANPLRVILFRNVATVAVTFYEQGGVNVRSLMPLPPYMYWDGQTEIQTLSDYDYVSYMAEMESVQWGVTVVNKRSYWLRKMTYDYYGDMEQNRGLANFYPDEIYAEDPNFEGFSIVNNGTQEMRDNNFIYITSDALVDKTSTPFETDYPHYPVREYGKAGIEYAYIPENTMAPMDQNYLSQNNYDFVGAYDVATCVVVGLNLLPYQMDTRSSLGTPYQNHLFVMNFGTSSSNAEIMTAEVMQRNLVLAYKILTDNLTEEELAGLTPGVEQEIIYMLEPAVNHMLSIGWDGSATINWDDQNIKSFTAGAITFYKEGRMYFTIPIEHFTPWDSYYGAGYGVVRNNMYHMIIKNQIDGLGSPSPEIPSNGINNVKFYITPWGFNSNEYVIGEPIRNPA
ncbi:fimbria major subunit [uncultured Alistipes sp.]|jgi:hypothetical protein bfra3_07627|uniref:fimbria major subunit n=1 Tax=uncultured Alistipes sp. TaxID=538949 RepID=UPI0025FD5BDA|nr:fimbria major subunit [uncultured Alistipes sp.]